MDGEFFSCSSQRLSLFEPSDWQVANPLGLSESSDSTSRWFQVAPDDARAIREWISEVFWVLVEAAVKQSSTKAFALWDDDAAIEVRSLSWYDEKLGWKCHANNIHNQQRSGTCSWVGARISIDVCMSFFSIELHFSTLICLRAVPSLYPFKKLACVANVVNPVDDPRSI